MVKEGTIVHNFVTVTKRLPLKARCVVALSLVIVIFELVSGLIELNSESVGNPKIANRVKPSLEVGKIRERKEIKLEDVQHGLDEFASNSVQEIQDTYNKASNLLAEHKDNLDKVIQLSKGTKLGKINTLQERIVAKVKLKYKGDITTTIKSNKQRNTTTTQEPQVVVGGSNKNH